MPASRSRRTRRRVPVQDADPLSRYRPIVDAVAALEPELDGVSDEKLRTRVEAIRHRLADGTPGTDHAIETCALVREAVEIYRKRTRFPSQGTSAPGWITGVHWSDHWSFWEEGYPAVMVTDTALFRYRHYHGPTDTPEKLDYRRLARVTVGMSQVIIELASPSSSASAD